MSTRLDLRGLLNTPQFISVRSSGAAPPPADALEGAIYFNTTEMQHYSMCGGQWMKMVNPSYPVIPKPSSKSCRYCGGTDREAKRNRCVGCGAPTREAPSHSQVGSFPSQGLYGHLVGVQKSA